MTDTEAIARVVLSVFRKQRRAAGTGREGFISFTRELADALLPILSRLYIQGAKQARAVPGDAENVVAAARARAQATARMINQTTSEWIREGKAEEYVFSADRAANIAITEANHAMSEGKVVVIAEKGGKIRWQVRGKACKLCLRLNNKVVKAGTKFGDDAYGNPIFCPPAHPTCKCRPVRVL